MILIKNLFFSLRVWMRTNQSVIYFAVTNILVVFGVAAALSALWFFMFLR